MKKKFTDLVDFVGGKPVLFEGTKPYVSTGALKSTTISREDIELVEFINRPSRADLEVKKDDILFAKMAFTDKRILIDNDTSNYIYSTGFFAVRAKPNIITTECLYYLLNSKTFKDQKDANSTGATQKAITNSGLKKIYLRIPNYNNQKEIAEILSNIEKIISFKERQLKEYDQLIKSRFVEMFGNVNDNTKKFVQEKLSNHLNIQGGYAFDSKKYLEEGIPILRIGNINTGIFIDKELKYWEYDENLVRYLIKPGDLLITLTGTVGKDDYGNVCIIDNSFPYYYLNQRNAKLDVFDTLTPIYLKYLLLNNSIKNRLTGISRGVRQANISNRDILNLNVPIPSIELQNQFTEFVEQVDKLKFKLQKSVDEAQLLFDSLLQKYFG